MDAHFETMQQRTSCVAARALLAKVSIAMLQMGQREPERQFGELRIAQLVGVGEVVARGRSESERGNGPRLELQTSLRLRAWAS